MIANTTEQGKWCIDFDPFKEHERPTMKEWFVLAERTKGNQNALIMYAEGPRQTKEDRKEDKIRELHVEH